MIYQGGVSTYALGGLASDGAPILRILGPRDGLQVEKLYSGDQDGAVAQDMKNLDTTGGAFFVVG